MHQALEYAEEDIGVEAALVCLVQHQHRVAPQLRILQALPQQRAVCTAIMVTSVHPVLCQRRAGTAGSSSDALMQLCPWEMPRMFTSAVSGTEQPTNGSSCAKTTQQLCCSGWASKRHACSPVRYLMRVCGEERSSNRTA